MAANIPAQPTSPAAPPPGTALIEQMNAAALADIEAARWLEWWATHGDPDAAWLWLLQAKGWEL